MDALDSVQLKQLCNRLLCGHGGVGLAKSLLVSGPGENEPRGSGPSWCVCAKCKEMGNPTEKVCCQKVKCITNYEFFSLCVNHMVLTLGILDNADTRADPIDYSPVNYRKIAYRHYILWNYGYLGRGQESDPIMCSVGHHTLILFTNWNLHGISGVLKFFSNEL